ncbi:uncharacterized protein LOC111014592 [Momordica charantia]|uniref:Uncharacterized protein LOC111014592 n=1 Tax=Momordica charantia TaxID=3673 RepID=A0A6J1CVB3_MOMCH|nr:uncharacterized protein LOC111014592 [Momordica charantia]
MAMEMEATAHKPRIIKLSCPSLSAIAPFLASDGHRIDIGAIATAFGLQPSTVKLNGHFLSRGPDLLSSVTWKSLLSFFSAKRLPVGNSDEDPLVVDGKLSKIGLKRARGSQEIVSGSCCEADEEDANLNAEMQTLGGNLVKNKKLKFRDFGSKHVDSSVFKCSPNGYKRKQCMEEVILLKKLKLNETKSGLDELSDTVQGLSDAANVVPRMGYSCSYNSKNMKRMREDETLVSAFCKRTR